MLIWHRVLDHLIFLDEVAHLDSVLQGDGKDFLEMQVDSVEECQLQEIPIYQDQVWLPADGEYQS